MIRLLHIIIIQAQTNAFIEKGKIPFSKKCKKFKKFVDKHVKLVYINVVSLMQPKVSGVQRSLVARAVWVREVVSSSLATPTICCKQINWAFSSVGQSDRLITGWSAVQVREGPPNNFKLNSLLWPGSSVGQSASLSRWRSTVRARFGSPYCFPLISIKKISMPRQLSRQSMRLKISVSVVRFRPAAPSAGVAQWQSI